MVGKIFINYRREDAKNISARVRDRLAREFGELNVFMDVDSLMPGQRFDRELKSALADTDVFIAIIGPHWMEILNQRKAANEHDYVLDEIGAALQRAVVVIPVLVDNATLPRADTLPDKVRELVLHQKHAVSHEQFGRDIEGLIDAIHFSRSRRKRSAPRKNGRFLAISVTAMLLVGVGAAIATGKSLEFFRDLLRFSVGTSGLNVAGASTSDASSPSEPPAAETAEARAKADAFSSDFDAGQLIVPGSGNVFKDRLRNGTECFHCPEMVVVPKGAFTMGSPPTEAERSEDETIIGVKIQYSFAVSRFSVTFEEWDACVDNGGCDGYHPKDQGWGRGKRPVINVNWRDVTAYVNWISRSTGKQYRLLSETEREYVTRAGTRTPFWWGTSITPGQANYNGNSVYGGGGDVGEFRQRTVAVDSFKPNPWGLFNVHGNVWEWTGDCWNDSNVGNPGNGMARAEGDCRRRVVRGGSWSLYPLNLRSSNRFGSPIDNRLDSLGFRLAREIAPGR